MQNLTDDVELMDGVTILDFGSVKQGEGDVVKTIRVSNAGTSILTLSVPEHPTGFLVNGVSPTTLAPNEFTDFDVALDSSAVGIKNGQLSFTNNDSDENPFHVTVTGEVTDATSASWQNGRNHLDVNGDTFVSPLDALLIINELTDHVFSDPVTGALPKIDVDPELFLDVTGDQIVSPLDALHVINNLPSAPLARAALRLVSSVDDRSTDETRQHDLGNRYPTQTKPATYADLSPRKFCFRKVNVARQFSQGYVARSSGKILCGDAVFWHEIRGDDVSVFERITRVSAQDGTIPRPELGR